MTLPERICAIVVSNSGLFCAGGGESGKLYLWEVTVSLRQRFPNTQANGNQQVQITTGRLLNVVDAHYRAIRTLRFSIDDGLLVTAGDDALCHSWPLST